MTDSIARLGGVMKNNAFLYVRTLLFGALAFVAVPVVLVAQAFPPSNATLRMSRAELEATVRPDMPRPRYDVQIEKSVWVPMRDGVRLSTDVYLPVTGEDRLPVILMRTPYDKRRQSLEPGKGGNAEVAMFVGQGFVVAVQDARGRFESQGVHRVSANARNDGYDALTWIADQSWSNGEIGTYGCSYLGEVQYMLAAMNHPNHSAMIPQSGGGALGLRGRFFNFGINHGGARELSTISWFLSGYGTRPKPTIPSHMPRAERIQLARYYPLSPTLPERDRAELFRTLPIIDIGTRAGLPPGDLRDFISHGPADQYWVDRGFLQEDDQIHVPALHVDSWYDKMIGATLRMFKLAQQNPDPTVADHQYAVISPSTHCGSEELTAPTIVGTRELGDARSDHWNLYVRWFDYWLKGIENGVTEMPHFSGYVMGKNEWQGRDDWPIPGTRFARHYLHSDGGANSRHGSGTLSTTAPGDEPPDVYLYDPNTPVPSLGGSFCCFARAVAPAGPHDHSDIELRHDVLVYTSAVLDRGVEVTGPLEVVLYVSSSAKDTDFFAKLLDVYPDGTAYNLKESVLRARYREGFAREVFMEEGEVYELRFPLHATSNYFAPGHRIRLEISSSSFPRITRNLNTGGRNYDETEGVVARNVVHHSRRYASYVVLPVVDVRR